MKEKVNLRNSLKQLFLSQRLAVLATQDRGGPYVNLVAFTATGNLKHLLFTTARATRKYANISKNPRVVLVVDNRSNEEADFDEATAVTAIGVVEEIEGPERERFQKLYLAKHPYLREFASSPDCAMLKVEVENYLVVSRLQNVAELRIKKQRGGSCGATILNSRPV